MFKLNSFIFYLLSFIGYALSENDSSSTVAVSTTSISSSISTVVMTTIGRTTIPEVNSCNDFYYLYNNTCVECPGYSGDCGTSGCCSNAFLYCIENTCMTCWVGYCWSINDGNRAKLQIAAQIILAVSLFLTAAILFILFWNSCIRKTREGVDRRRVPPSDYPTLNSIQRLVLMQLQDRPPPYNASLMYPRKVSYDGLEAPPAYIDAVQLPPLGGENLAFIFGEVSQIARDNTGAPAYTRRSNQTILTSSQSNSVNQGTVSAQRFPEANSLSVETSSNPVSWLSSESSENISSRVTPTCFEEVNITGFALLSELHL